MVSLGHGEEHLFYFQCFRLVQAKIPPGSNEGGGSGEKVGMDLHLCTHTCVHEGWHIKRKKELGGGENVVGGMAMILQ